jgi:hypothetical protein
MKKKKKKKRVSFFIYKKNLKETNAKVFSRAFNKNWPK